MSDEALKQAAHEGVRNLLRAIGEDPSREGLKDTPSRVLRAFEELTSGGKVDVGALLKVSFDEGYTEAVALSDIDFVSTCEHHLLPFVGKAHIVYLPTGRVVGLSKLARTVEAFARRLQVQERMTRQIADALMEYLKPSGALVVVEATHSCMVCRGVRKPNAIMRTAALRGTMQEPAVRAEAYRLIGVGG